MQQETWKEILNGRYYVSNKGNVKSCKKRIHTGGGRYFHKDETVLKQNTNSVGYKRVSLETGKQYLVHRLVLEGFTGNTQKYADHINGDRSDNRIENLRWCTQRQNMGNQKKKKNSKNKYKGASYLPSIRKWRAYIVVNYKQINLGCYPKEDDAAEAYNLAAIKHFGEFAKLNIIDKSK